MEGVVDTVCGAVTTVSAEVWAEAWAVSSETAGGWVTGGLFVSVLTLMLANCAAMSAISVVVSGANAREGCDKESGSGTSNDK